MEISGLGYSAEFHGNLWDWLYTSLDISRNLTVISRFGIPGSGQYRESEELDILINLKIKKDQRF